MGPVGQRTGLRGAGVLARGGHCGSYGQHLGSSAKFSVRLVDALVGEHNYRDWHVERVQETRISVYLFCLAANTLLTAAVGGAVMFFSEGRLVLFAIGMGIVAYAVAVAFYTLLGIYRLRRTGRLTDTTHHASFS